jgi:hypothetical protein
MVDRLTALARPVPLLLTTLALRFSALVLPQFFSGDEATYSALAVRMLNGYVLYAGGVDHKPPGVDLLYAGVYALAGRNHILAVRALLILVVWATGMAVGRAAVALDGRRVASMAGLIYVCASSCGMPRDALPANTELFLNLPLALAAWIVAAVIARSHDADNGEPATERVVLAKLFAAGVLTGIAGLFKYQASLAGIAWAFAIFWAAPRSGRLRARLASLAAGFLLVATVLCGYFYARAAWDAFTFWGWRYNLIYISALTPLEKFTSFTASTLWIALFWAAPIALAAIAVRMRRLPALTVAWLVASYLAISVGGRFFRFYYLMALPPLSLAAAAGLPVLVERRWRLRQPILAAGLLSLGISLGLPWTWNRLSPSFWREHEKVSAVGQYIKEHSSRDERVFVWGGSTQIYYFADRVMGTRFAFCNYHVGKIWGSWSYDVDAPDTSMFVVPRAWTELLDDLDREPPEIVVDAAAGGLGNFDRHPIARYPQLASRVARAYHLEATVAGVPIYRRVIP